MRVAVTTSYGYWKDFSPLDLFEPGGKRMIGGGETAMLWLSRGLAAAGHEVDLFYDISPGPGNYYGINFFPKELRATLLCLKDYDLLISWEDMAGVSVNHRARAVIYAVQCNSFDYLGNPLGLRDWVIDAYQAVSVWQAGTLLKTDPAANPAKFFTFPNGVDLRRYAPPLPPRDPLRVIHSSSPDRGLHHLVRMWPRIKRKVPGASLHLFYDMAQWFKTVEEERAKGYMLITTERADLLREGIKKAEGMDLVLHGGVGQWELAQEQLMSGLGVYPCDPVSPTEGWSVTILEYLSAGLPVITSSADAFPELWPAVTTQLPLPVDDDDWVEVIVEHLKGREEGAGWVEERIEIGKEFARQFEWRVLGERYARKVEEIVAKKTGEQVERGEEQGA